MAFTDVARVDKTMGIVALILNIIPIPGLGSVIAGVMGKHQQTLIIGIIQILLTAGLFFVTPLLATIGFIWSIIWGILIFMKSS